MPDDANLAERVRLIHRYADRHEAVPMNHTTARIGPAAGTYVDPVAHFSRLIKVVIDVPARDHDRELFWEAALGQPLPQFAFPQYHGAALHGQEFWLLTQCLGDGPARVHLDIHTDDLEAEVARLERLGAECVQRMQSWQLMRDPAGLVFCVIPDPPGTLNEGNARRWE